MPEEGRVVAEERGGELVQDGRVDVPGHDRHDHRVTLAARRRGRAARRPRRFGVRGAVQAAQLIQRHVQLDLRRLPGPVGDAARRDQLPARFLQPVMVTLAHGAGVLRAGLAAEHVQHRVQRGGALRGQVTFDPARAVQGPVQPQPPIREPATPVAVGRGAAAPHLLRQPGQVREFRAARRGGQQDLIGVRLLAFGEFGGPGADLPRPRRRDSPAASASPTAGWAASRRAPKYPRQFSTAAGHDPAPAASSGRAAPDEPGGHGDKQHRQRGSPATPSITESSIAVGACAAARYGPLDR